MARTNRKEPYSLFRKPRNFSERAVLKGVLIDSYVEDIKLSKINRIMKRLSDLPTDWDDISFSMYK